MKQILRKRLGSVINGNREFIENEYYAKRDFITKSDLELINELHGDDAEAAYDYGLAFDWNGDLLWIDVDKFLAWAENCLKEQDEDNKKFGWDKSVEYSHVKRLVKKFGKYRGFDVWI